MAFAVKTDYCGLSAITELANLLVVRDATENGSAEKYQPQGNDGSFIGTEVFGADKAPTNSYGLKGNINLAAGKIKLNAITVVDGVNYALESIEIGTSAGAAPTLSATCQEIEADATAAAQCVYEIPALVLTKKHHAQVLFSAFELSGTGCELTECSASISGSINKDKVEGVKIGSDINSGVITVTGTIIQSGTTAPTLTVGEGWKLTGQLNCTNPEASYKSFTFELQKVLAKTHPAT